MLYPSNCVIDCGTDPQPFLPDSCVKTIVDGGINTLIVANCAAEWPELPEDYHELSPEDQLLARIAYLTVVAALVTAGEVIMVNNLLGEKPAPDNTTIRTESCKAEMVLNKTFNINFQHFYTDATDKSEYDFWNDFNSNIDRYKIAWVGCDGFIRGWLPNPTIYAHNVVPQTKEEKAFWEGMISWIDQSELKPFFLEDLISVLNGGAVPTPPPVLP